MTECPFDEAVRRYCARGLTISQTARKLGCGHHRIARCRDRLGLVFSATPGVDRGASQASGDRAVVEVEGLRISLPPLPFEITPDARHETAPRHRGLIGGRVAREELVWAGWPE